jgi:hypothetical protein
VGSLSSVFGLIEIMTELNGLVDEPEVRDKWVEFCRLYKATRDEQAEATGQHWATSRPDQAARADAPSGNRSHTRLSHSRGVVRTTGNQSEESD